MCVGAALHSAVQQSVAQAHALQKGVGVEMATAANAHAWPQADDSDAWVVTVDNTGRLYFGADAMTPEDLKEWMIRHPRRRDQKLYIKADARAPFASLEKALDAAGSAGFAEPVLLVNQRDSSAKPGIVVPPRGLAVTIDGASRDAQSVVVEITGSAKEPATLAVNREPVSWESLQDRLRESVESRDEKSVFVEADGQAAFAQVARIIDACGAVKAKAVLSGATL
jgi:biopolymer transport protein ExbD